MAETNGANHWPAFRIRLSVLMVSTATAVSAYGGTGSPVGGGASTSISFSPPKVFLQARAGSTLSLASDISLSSIGGGPLVYTASVQSDGGWLRLGNAVSGLTVSLTDSISASAPGTLRVVAAVDHLPEGSYNGTILLSTPGSSENSETVPVNLLLRGEPTVIVRPDYLKISRRQGVEFNPPLPRTISVFGERTDFRVRISTDQAGWLGVSPTAGTTPADLTVTVDPSGLDSGSYQADLSIVNANNNALGIATVSLEITTDAPTPTISPSAVSVEAHYGSSQPRPGRLRSTPTTTSCHWPILRQAHPGSR